MHLLSISAKIILAFFLLSFVISASAQTSIKGVLVDSSEKKPLVNASVNIIREKDSILLTTTRTDKNGAFQFLAVPLGKIIVMISYPKYADYIDKFELSSTKELDLKTIYLQTKALLLQEIIIQRNISAIRIKGDTTEYKADSFRVTPNADVQELLKKMPGIQVNAKGEITAQGEKVNKVLVDGEEFFSDDPAVVTKNLRADAINKVQVFDKKSDQANFTGIDDGQTSKTINLELKEDKKNGYFGKTEIGSNFGKYQNGKLLANAFKGKKKLAGYITTDNTKFESLSWDELKNYSDGGNTTTTVGDDGGISVSFSGSDDYDDNKGLPNQQTAGLNFSNKWKNVNTNTAAQFQRLATTSIGSSYSKTLLSGNSFTNITQNEQQVDKKKYKFNTTNEWGTDSTGVFKIILKGANTIKNASADYNGATVWENGLQINQTNRQTSLNENDKQVIANLSYRKKLAKKGRTISFLTDINFNDKAQNGTLVAQNSYYNTAGTLSKTDLIDQTKINQQTTSSIATSIVYTEPLSEKSFLIYKYGLNVATNNAERNSFNKNGLGQYVNRVDSLSNNFEFNTLNNNGSFNYRYVAKKFNFVAGTGVGVVKYGLKDIAKNSDRSIYYKNILPTVAVTYKPKQQRRINLSYNGTTINPTLLQIQPIIDNSDPLNITVGNAKLQQGFNNAVSLEASDFKVLKSRYIYFRANFSNTTNAISSSSTVDSSGKQTAQFVNVDGNYNYRSNLGYTIEVYKGIYMDLTIGKTFNRYVNFVNTLKNVNDNNSFNYSINFSYWGDKWINFYSQFNANQNSTVSSIRPGTKVNYWNYNVYGNVSFKFKKPKIYIEINNDLTIYQRSAIFPNQRNVYLVSPSIRKVLGKKDAWEVKLYAYDVLNQNSNIVRNMSSNFIAENINNGVRKYYLFSLVYNFSKNGKPAGF